MYLGTLIKSNAEVILDGGEPFVCHFDLAATKNVHFVFLELVKPFDGYLVEHGRLNHCSVTVDQVEIKDLAFPSVIFVGSHCSGLLYHSGFDAPVLAELV